MKLIREALNYSNPRSLWHRPSCQCVIDTCGCMGAMCAIVGLAIVVSGLLFLCLSVVPFVVVFICRTTIAVGLDDRDGSLLNISRTIEVAVGGGGISPVVQYRVTLLLGLVVFGALVASIIDVIHQLPQHRRNEAPLRTFWFKAIIGCLLLTALGPWIAIALYYYLNGAVVGFVGWIVDIITSLGGRGAVLHSEIVFSVRMAKELAVLSGNNSVAVFYDWYTAIFTLLGIATTLLFWACFCSIPFVLCYRQVCDDVKDTFEAIQV